MCQFVNPPSQALVLAQSVLNSPRQLLEQVEANGELIAEAERKRIANMHEHLSEELIEMAAYIETTPEEEETNLEGYDEWLFY